MCGVLGNSSHSNHSHVSEEEQASRLVSQWCPRGCASRWPPWLQWCWTGRRRCHWMPHRAARQWARSRSNLPKHSGISKANDKVWHEWTSTDINGHQRTSSMNINLASCSLLESHVNPKHIVTRALQWYTHISSHDERIPIVLNCSRNFDDDFKLFSYVLSNCTWKQHCKRY